MLKLGISRSGGVLSMVCGWPIAPDEASCVQSGLATFLYFFTPHLGFTNFTYTGPTRQVEPTQTGIVRQAMPMIGSLPSLASLIVRPPSVTVNLLVPSSTFHPATLSSLNLDNSNTTIIPFDANKFSAASNHLPTPSYDERSDNQSYIPNDKER